MTDDTDRQKRDEALARLVGWERCDPSAYQFDTYYHPDGRGRRGPPNMATPEGADELLEFCRQQSVFISIVPTAKDYFWHAYAGGKEHYPGASAEPTFTRPDAVCQAVLALIEGRYLTEKEPTDD